MITDRHGYPVELEVMILERVKTTTATDRKTFNKGIKNIFGYKAYQILLSFWKNGFIRADKCNFGSQFTRHGVHGNRLVLTSKGVEYLKNMTEELNKLKEEQKIEK